MSQPQKVSLPTVDVEFLAKTLGIPADTIKPYMLQNWHQCYTAKCIIDTFTPYQPGDRMLSEIALKNGERWIDRAYEKGRRDGIEMERQRWEKKIRELFGIKD
jgi:hypothetical protein